jgi:hypothetical protein
LQNSAIALKTDCKKVPIASVLGIGTSNLIIRLAPKKNGITNGQYQSSNISFQTPSTRLMSCEYFETLNKADNTAIKQYIEWHKVTI